MDHITLRRDNRDIPSLLCFFFSPLRTPAHACSRSLFLRLSVLLFNSPFFSVAHRGGRRINQKSFEREAEVRQRRGGGEKRRRRAKSIPQVNLRPEIFYTINKQGESGDWMREGTVGGAGGRVQREAKEDVCSLHAMLLPCSTALPGDSHQHRRGLFFFSPLF